MVLANAVKSRAAAEIVNTWRAPVEEYMDKIDLLCDLERWQACSHPVLADRRPHELFEASFVERYERLHKDLLYRLIRVQGTISTLERLRRFPFAVLYSPGEMEFWRLVIENFVDTAVLMLHGLVNDTGPDVHTLTAFRSEIVKGPWLPGKIAIW